MSGIYDVTLTSSGAANLAVLGNYVKVYSATGALQLKLDGGEAFQLMEGQGVRLADGKTFRDVQVVNKSGAAQVAYIFIGEAKIEDSRITGTVGITSKLGAGIVWTETGLPTAVGVNATTVILAPGANLRGAILRSVALNVVAAASGAAEVRCIVAPTTPVSASPSNAFQPLSAGASASATTVKDSGFLNLTIPVGWGIWIVTNHTTTAATAAACSVSYEPL